MLEFEAKKGKLHVAQAATKQNHYPTLESVTYVFYPPNLDSIFLPAWTLTTFLCRPFSDTASKTSRRAKFPSTEPSRAPLDLQR